MANRLRRAALPGLVRSEAAGHLLDLPSRAGVPRRSGRLRALAGRALLRRLRSGALLSSAASRGRRGRGRRGGALRLDLRGSHDPGRGREHRDLHAAPHDPGESRLPAGRGGAATATGPHAPRGCARGPRGGVQAGGGGERRVLRGGLSAARPGRAADNTALGLHRLVGARRSPGVAADPRRLPCSGRPRRDARRHPAAQPFVRGCDPPVFAPRESGGHPRRAVAFARRRLGSGIGRAGLAGAGRPAAGGLGIWGDGRCSARSASAPAAISSPTIFSNSYLRWRSPPAWP